MEPTARAAAWSAWAGWAPRDLLDARRVRLALHHVRPHIIPMGEVRDLGQLRRVDWPRLPPHQVALYTPKQIRHLIRLDALGQLPTAPPDRWGRPDPDTYWRVHDFLQNVHLDRSSLSELASPDTSTRGAPGAGGGGGGGAAWEGAARGWAAGALLLAALVLVVRALERYLHKKLFKGRRRSSEEWHTPNVLATSHQYGIDTPPRLDDSDSFPSDGGGSDLPPPYSECANTEDDLSIEDVDPKPPGMEEPPPPYSACYFTNPKDGIPTVHFYRRNDDSAGTSVNTDHEPSISNVSQENDRISDGGCETNASVGSEVNREEITVNIVNEISEVNAENVQNAEASSGDAAPVHIVQMIESASAQGRVVTV